MSASKSGELYDVTLHLESCDCLLKCNCCDVCVHMYSCSCVDYAVHYTACKHVHLVHLQISEEENGVLMDVNNGEEHETASIEEPQIKKSPTPLTDEPETNEPHPCTTTETVEDTTTEERLDYYSRLLQSRNTDSLLDCKQTFQHKAAELQLLVESCSNRDTITSAISHLSSAICLLKADKTCQSSITQMLPVQRPAPNSNSEKQIRYQSTKKRKVVYSRWVKPSFEEEQRAKENMSRKVSIQVCGVCFNEDNDDNDQEDIVDLIECQVCTLWVHLACACEQNNDYVCLHCRRNEV